MVGKTTVFDSETCCTVSNHITRITVKEDVNPYYVAAFFNTLRDLGYWKLLCTNFNNQAGINVDTLQEVKIPLPSKSMQDYIAAEIVRRMKTARGLKREAKRVWRAAIRQFEEILFEN